MFYLFQITGESTINIIVREIFKRGVLKKYVLAGKNHKKIYTMGPCYLAPNPKPKGYGRHSALLRSSTVKKLELSVTYMVSSVLTWRMQDFSQNSQIW